MGADVRPCHIKVTRPGDLFSVWLDRDISESEAEFICAMLAEDHGAEALSDWRHDAAGMAPGELVEIYGK